MCADTHRELKRVLRSLGLEVSYVGDEPLSHLLALKLGLLIYTE